MEAAMSVELHVAGIVLCFLASAFFSGTESGMLSINHARLMHRVRGGLKSAVLLNRYLSDLQRCLTTILVGNNLVNVILSTLSASLARACFPSSPLVQTAWAVSVACLMLCFCEYLPKLFFITRPLRRTLWVIRVFSVIERVLAPLTAAILVLTKWLIPNNQKGARQRFMMSREYIQNVVSDDKEGSRITAFERLMINRVLTLQSQTASQVMTPLSRVTTTTASSPLRVCYQQVRDSGHVRLPVFSDDRSRCVGVLDVLKVLAVAPDPEQTRAGDCMQKPFFVNAGERADDVLPLMRKYRYPMVLVRGRGEDEVLGIITEENVLFALTGSLKKVGA
jgi:CBS domain containing-hemolysin-like protein